MKILNFRVAFALFSIVAVYAILSISATNSFTIQTTFAQIATNATGT